MKRCALSRRFVLIAAALAVAGGGAALPGSGAYAGEAPSRRRHQGLGDSTQNGRSYLGLGRTRGSGSSVVFREIGVPGERLP